MKKNLAILVLLMSAVRGFSQSTEEAPIETSFSFYTEIELIANKGANGYAYDGSDADTEIDLSFSKAVKEDVTVYWGLFDWLNWGIDNSDRLDVYTNETTAYVGVEVSAADFFTFGFDMGVDFAYNPGENMMMGLASNQAFGFEFEEQATNLSIENYLNPMFNVGTKGWYLHDVLAVALEVNFLDLVTNKVGGGFFTEFEYEGYNFYPGLDVKGSEVTNELFAGLGFSIPTNNEDISNSFKVGMAYVNEIIKAGNVKEVFNDVGALFSVSGSYKGVGLFFNLLPMMYASSGDPYLRSNIGLEIGI